MIRGFLDRVHVEDVERVGALREWCGRAEERGFGAAAGFGEEGGFVQVDRAV